MATARDAAKRHSQEYQDAYARLTRVLTNMHNTERTALDESERYDEAMELVIAGRDAEAVELVLPLRTEDGDRWRAAARQHGVIPTDNFVNEV